MIERHYGIEAHRYEAACEWVEAHLDPMQVVMPVVCSWAVVAVFETLADATIFKLTVGGRECWEWLGDNVLAAKGREFETLLGDVDADARSAIQEMDGVQRSEVLSIWFVSCAFSREADAKRFAHIAGAVEINRTTLDG